jgi:hypothetical protein
MSNLNQFLDVTSARKEVLQEITDLVNKLCYWEDPDQMLFLSSTEDGGISIGDQEWRRGVEAPDILTALEQYWDQVKEHYPEEEE